MKKVEDEKKNIVIREDDGLNMVNDVDLFVILLSFTRMVFAILFFFMLLIYKIFYFIIIKAWQLSV